MSSLSEQSQDRKSRLAALRNKRKQPSSTLQEASPSTSEQSTTNEEPQLKKQTPLVRSRNFNFDTNSQNKAIDQLPSLIKPIIPASKDNNYEKEEEEEDSSAPPKFILSSNETLEALTASIQAQILSQFSTAAQYQSLSSLKDKKEKTKKITWDLERDLKEDMDLLEERTDVAIKRAVRERLRKFREAEATSAEDD